MDMNGDVVCVSKDSEKETMKLTLLNIEPNALKEAMGEDNVEIVGDQIVVRHANTQHPARSYAFLLLLKDGRRWIKVIPNGTVTEIGAATYVSSSIFGREITINCAPDENGVRIYDYIQAESDAPSNGSEVVA